MLFVPVYTNVMIFTLCSVWVGEANYFCCKCFIAGVDKLLPVPFVIRYYHNNHQCHGIDGSPEQGLIIRVNDIGDNLSPATMTIYCIASVVDTGEQLMASVVDTGKKHKIANISANLNKNSKWPQEDTRGPGENWFVKKSEVENQNTPLKFKTKKM